MLSKQPRRDSARTQERALALTWYRGCSGDNPCWPDCYEAALDTILDGDLDEEERPYATTSAYWKYTNLSGSSAHWGRKLAERRGA